MGKISEIFNFDNIGRKIKNLAKWSCWITILLIWIAAPITLIVLLSEEPDLFWIPLVGAIVGPVFIWIGSWAMYAFGEFVEDIHAMRDKEGTTKEVNAKHKAEMKAKYVAKKRAKREADDEYNDITCPKCGELLSFLKGTTNGICPECGAEFEIQ